MGVLGILMTLKVMPNVKEPTVKTFDLIGFVLLVVAMIGWSLVLNILPHLNIPNGLVFLY